MFHALRVVTSPGNEGLLPDCRRPLHPVSSLLSGQSLFWTQEHALFRWESIPHLPVCGLNRLSPYINERVVCCSRSPAQVFDGTDIRGPHHQVRFKEKSQTIFERSLHIKALWSEFDCFTLLIQQRGHSLPEVRCQSSPEQLCRRTVNSLSKLYPFKVFHCNCDVEHRVWGS